MAENSYKDNSRITSKQKFVLCLSTLIAAFLIIVLVIILRACSRGPAETIEAAGRQMANIIDKSGDVAVKIANFFATREKFESVLGSISSQKRLRRLNFFQRNQVCLFRIIRYIDKDGSKHNYSEFYKKESDKKKLSEMPILLNQYCEWEAKGVFEFNFYIDLENLAIWDYHWDKERFVLNLFPPDITAGTPAELEPIEYKCIADSIGISKKTTREELEKAISAELKMALAEEQKKFFYEEARLAVKDLFVQFFQFQNIEKIPDIIVIFPHEKEKSKISPERDSAKGKAQL